MSFATQSKTSAKKATSPPSEGKRATHRPKGLPNMADLEAARKLPPFLIRSF